VFHVVFSLLVNIFEHIDLNISIFLSYHILNNAFTHHNNCIELEEGMKKLLIRLVSTDNNAGSLLLRVPVGVILIAHGAQKLFAWFGGYGLEGTGSWMASIGLEPGYLMALMAGSAEFFGGIGLVLGLLTRPAALVAAVTMLVGLVVVHLGNGFFLDGGGIEYALALFAATSALAIQGGGMLSIDRIINRYV
jgi:putative oxidoreductase